MKNIVSIAPMMDCTDRHDRYFIRLISRNVKLYTEMKVANAIIKGDKDFHLKFSFSCKKTSHNLCFLIICNATFIPDLEI